MQRRAALAEVPELVQRLHEEHGAAADGLVFLLGKRREGVETDIFAIAVQVDHAVHRVAELVAAAGVLVKQVAVDHHDLREH